AGFSPIGNHATPFSGTYDGDRHTIDRLTINGLTTGNIGLFGYTTGAKVKNLGLTNVSVTGYAQPGLIVGYNDKSIVTNCYTTGNMIGNDSTIGVPRQAEY
ncbi:MAG: peptidase M26, partial [Geobacteraceae bacterium]|nr:peptidase M26 [Geobacteraceae bacterium]